MTVRAKMKCVHKTEHAYGHYTVRFESVYDDTIPEDRRFQKATPSAHAEFVIDNLAASDQFKPGHYYYVDFVRAE